MSKVGTAQLPRLVRPNNELSHKKNSAVRLVIISIVCGIGVAILLIWAAASLVQDAVSGDSERDAVDSTYKTVKLPSSLTPTGKTASTDNFIEGIDTIGNIYGYSYPKTSDTNDYVREVDTVFSQIEQSLAAQGFSTQNTSQESSPALPKKDLYAENATKHMAVNVTVQGGDNNRSVTVKAWQTKEEQK